MRIVVVGAGIVGAACARVLTRAGFDVTVLERGAVAGGTSSIAGILLANDVLGWRTTSGRESPRGLFCGIGVCFDCVVTVDGIPDVRACQRRARGGEHVERQYFPLPTAVRGD